MLAGLVQFKLPNAVTPEQAEAMFLNASPAFHGIPGLIRKYFLLSEDGTTAGGVYLWQSREDAERFYNGGFKDTIAERYGSEPSIRYFDSPVIVDNLSAETITTW